MAGMEGAPVMPPAVAEAAARFAAYPPVPLGNSTLIQKEIQNIAPPTDLELMKEFAGDIIPLADVPVGNKRRELISGGEKLSTSNHESDHIFAAWALGARPEFVTVIPNHAEGYLGLTIVEANPRAFQIIAGAPSARNRSGNGGDMMAIAQIDAYLGKTPGSSVESAISAGAHLINSNFPPSVREIFAEILAVKGKLNGGEIESAIHRAFIEAAFKENNKELLNKFYEVRENWIKHRLSLRESGIDIKGEFISVINYGQTDRWLIGGKNGEKTEIFTCSGCGGTGGVHGTDCPFNPDRQKKDEEMTRQGSFDQQNDDSGMTGKIQSIPEPTGRAPANKPQEIVVPIRKIRDTILVDSPSGMVFSNN